MCWGENQPTRGEAKGRQEDVIRPFFSTCQAHFEGPTTYAPTLCISPVRNACHPRTWSKHTSPVPGVWVTSLRVRWYTHGRARSHQYGPKINRTREDADLTNSFSYNVRRKISAIPRSIFLYTHACQWHHNCSHVFINYVSTTNENKLIHKT
jgi:hypothetical protein